MTSSWLLVTYCVLVALSSLTGGVLPSLIRMTHLRTQLLMSFVSGLMLGIAILHMLPHSIEILGSPSRSAYFTLGGMIGMFLLLRAFHSHSHGSGVAELPTQSLPAEAHGECLAHAGENGHAHSAHTHSHAGSASKAPSINWLGMLFGLGLHTMMDGVALAASVAAEADHGPWLGLAGIGTFLAVALHKPLDAFSIGSVMRKGGWSTRGRSIVNACFALACPTGALLFWLGATQLASSGSTFVGCGLAVSAGFFICIALADLLPEVHFHDHDRGKLTLALFLGILLAIGIENLPGHEHGTHSDATSGAHAGHDHSGHDHSGHDHSGHDHDH
jgi:zinc and cadmium transporter